MVFKKLSMENVENIIDCIDEIFGKTVMYYDTKRRVLVLDKPIWFPEAPETRMVAIGMVQEEETGEDKMIFEMLHDDGTIYHINGVEI